MQRIAKACRNAFFVLWSSFLIALVVGFSFDQRQVAILIVIGAVTFSIFYIVVTTIRFLLSLSASDNELNPRPSTPS